MPGLQEQSCLFSPLLNLLEGLQEGSDDVVSSHSTASSLSVLGPDLLALYFAAHVVRAEVTLVLKIRPVVKGLIQSVEGSYDYQKNKVPRRVREP